MTQSAEALLFQAALGIQEPWMIKEIRLNEANHELHITLDFVKGATFSCPECAQACKAYDTKERTCRHLNFFQFKTYLHARLPRVQCTEHGIKAVIAPWACVGSGFTLLFEALALLLMKETITKVARTHFSGHYLTFDKFHLHKLVNEVVDQVRKIESKHRKDLKDCRCLWLKRKHDFTFLFEWVSWVKGSTLEPVKK